MQALVSGILAIEKAKLDLQGITLIVGENEQGKTTLAEAIGAALCADPHMRGITTNKNLSALLRDDHDRGMVFLTHGDKGSTEMTWPAGKRETKGEAPPQASLVAVGRRKPLRVPIDERTKFLVSALGAHPRITDLNAALDATKTPPALREEVIKHLKENGWGATERYYRDQAARLKGAWEQITGDNYGPVKAEGWSPEDWTPDLEDRTEEDLEREVAQSREFLEQVIAARASGGAELDALREKAGEMDDLKAALEKQDNDIEQAQMALVDAKKTLAELPNHEVTGGLPCPHGCEGRQLSVRQTIDGYRLVAVTPENLSKKELKKRREDFASAQGAVQHLDNAIKLARSEIIRIEERMREAQNAQDRLIVAESKTKKAEGEELATEEAETAARMQLDSANGKLNAFMTRTAAAEKQSQIAACLALIEILKPDGLRKTKLQETLADFNSKRLQPLAKAFGLGEVVLDDNLEATLDGRHYLLLSDGARYAVDAVLQVAVAQLDGSDMVILDGADILVGDRRPGLLMMLASAKINALVCMAQRADGKVPPLEKSGLGRVYRLQNGQVAGKAA